MRLAAAAGSLEGWARTLPETARDDNGEPFTPIIGRSAPVDYSLTPGRQPKRCLIRVIK